MNSIRSLFWRLQLRLLIMVWSFETCTTMTPLSNNLALLKPMRIICLMKGMSLIDIDAIWLLSLCVC